MTREPATIQGGVPMFWDPITDLGGTSSMPAPVHAPPAPMRYDLPLTHTMWKMVEAVECVDYLKASRAPGNREHAFNRALDGLYAP